MNKLTALRRYIPAACLYQGVDRNIFKQCSLAIALWFLSCQSAPVSPVEPEVFEAVTNREKSIVEACELKEGIFYKEIISNGKLYAARKADIKFRISDVITQINARNGSKVKAGAVVAKLTNFTFLNRLQRARSLFDKARLDLHNVLIGQGYHPADSGSIPADVLKMTKTKSGYDLSFLDLQAAEYDYNNTLLKAPISGLIANLKAKEHSLSSTTEIFCTVIDNSVFHVSFQVLESEVDMVSIGQSVTIVPFVSDSLTYAGTVAEINPVIDGNGLVTMSASVNNDHQRLYEGMNVRLCIKESIKGKLVVPKTAVVTRSGKHVVFTVEQGHAKWNYVKIAEENSTHYAIAEGLKPGVTVIVSGNLNLAHDAVVEISKTTSAL
jgi:multidrug efflux pump subunit AcrA (membrane-fusion protein)